MTNSFEFLPSYPKRYAWFVEELMSMFSTMNSVSNLLTMLLVVFTAIAMLLVPFEFFDKMLLMFWSTIKSNLSFGLYKMFFTCSPCILDMFFLLERSIALTFPSLPASYRIFSSELRVSALGLLAVIFSTNWLFDSSIIEIKLSYFAPRYNKLDSGSS